MPSPDLSGFVNLTLYDKNPQDVFNAAISELRTKLPTYVAYEGNIDVVVMEELALETAEAVYAINRLPGTIAEVLFLLLGVQRYAGAPAKATVTFTLADALGHVVPAGTRVSLTLGLGLDPIVFTTDVDLTVPQSVAGGTVAVTAVGNSVAPNGAGLGSGLALVDSLFYVNSAQLATIPSGGQDPESTSSWLARASTTLTRLNNTLVQPQHFTAFALLDPLVNRAITIDQYNAGWFPPTAPMATPSTTGGTLPAASYAYQVTTITAAGESLPSTAVTAATTGTTGSVALSWTAPPTTTGAGATTGTRVYRQTGGAGAFGLIGTAAVAATTFTDTNATAPGVAPPTTNTTASATAPGYLTVAVYGPSGPVSVAEKALLQATMRAATQANLSVTIIDPTITAVNVTAAVKILPGQVAATVQAACVTALQGYLSPQVWPWAGTVRVNALISLLTRVAGVDFVQSVTVPAADLALAGAAPLVTYGTLTVTAS